MFCPNQIVAIPQGGTERVQTYNAFRWQILWKRFRPTNRWTNGRTKPLLGKPGHILSRPIKNTHSSNVCLIVL